MKRVKMVLLAGAAALLLSGCYGWGHGYGRDGGGHHGDQMGRGLGAGNQDAWNAPRSSQPCADDREPGEEADCRRNP